MFLIRLWLSMPLLGAQLYRGTRKGWLCFDMVSNITESKVLLLSNLDSNLGLHIDKATILFLWT
jgi:hypothetical protein